MVLFKHKGREKRAGSLLMQTAIKNLRSRQEDMDARLELLERQREALDLVSRDSYRRAS